MMTQKQGRTRLRISDQDALLKWCRSNGFFLTQRDATPNLAFDIKRQKNTDDHAAEAEYVLEVSEKTFAIHDAQNEGIAQGAELRNVLKQVSAQLAAAHSAAS